jgi:glutamate 5-kinase
MARAVVTTVSIEDATAGRRLVSGAQTIVVKVGSNVLVGGTEGVVNRRVFTGLVEALGTLSAVPGRRLVLVTSGAVAAGRRLTGRFQNPAAPETLSQKQALAAVGQPRLMHMYAEEFAFYNKRVAQILLTRADIDDRDRFLTARTTLRELAGMDGIVPIINENDSVANEEIRFGDNDQLASLVCGLVGADLLIILSDVAGLYDKNPARHNDAVRIHEVYADDSALNEIAEPAEDGSFGTGGMLTKIRAARMAASYGVPTIIAAGREHDVLGRALSGEPVGTLFVPREEPLTLRKAWIRFGTNSTGEIVVDNGAAKAVCKDGRSLLPIGITGVQGDFISGAAVTVRSEDGTPIARGLTAYSSDDLRRIQGLNSSDVFDVLGYHNGDAVIHRDDLVLIEDTHGVPDSEEF